MIVVSLFMLYDCYVTFYDILNLLPSFLSKGNHDNVAVLYCLLRLSTNYKFDKWKGELRPFIESLYSFFENIFQ